MFKKRKTFRQNVLYVQYIFVYFFIFTYFIFTFSFLNVTVLLVFFLFNNNHKKYDYYFIVIFNGQKNKSFRLKMMVYQKNELIKKLISVNKLFQLFKIIFILQILSSTNVPRSF